jgi:pentatricopeptide repeat protein
MFGYSQAGKTKEVLNLLNKMMEEGIEPDVVTFVVVLSAYIHAGSVEDGQMVFDIIGRVYHHMPTIEHYSCMVDLCSRAGHFDKAIAAIENVPVSNRLPLWLSLLGACSKWTNLALGKLAFEQSINLDEKCNAAYVSMANIYAAAGMHAEAASLESLRAESETLRIWGHHLLPDKAFVDYG